jgi:hypothetical protein
MDKVSLYAVFEIIKFAPSISKLTARLISVVKRHHYLTQGSQYCSVELETALCFILFRYNAQCLASSLGCLEAIQPISLHLSPPVLLNM